MEIRRKVFSLLQDENGEERYYSTNEFELSYDEETGEKMFSEKEMSKAGKAAATTAAVAATAVAALEGANLLKKGVSYKKAVNVASRAAKDMRAAAMKAGQGSTNRAEILTALQTEKKEALEKIAKDGWTGDGIEFVEKANKRVGDAARWAGHKAVAGARELKARQLNRHTNRIADNARKRVAKEQRRAFGA